MSSAIENAKSFGMSCYKNIQYLVVSLTILFCGGVFAAEQREFDGQNLKHLQFKNMSGKTHIIQSKDKQVQVEFEKIKFDENCELLISQSQDTLSIEVHYKKRKFFNKECEVDFKVSLPKKMDLSVHSGSGNVNVEGIEGGMSFTLGSGDLTVKSTWIDDSKIRVGSGDVSIEGLAGELDIIAGSGDVKARFAAHALPDDTTIKTGSGSIEVNGLKSNADIITGSGSVELNFNKPEAKGSVSIKSGSGNAKVSFPDTVSVATDFKAGSGKVHNDLQSAHANWTIHMRSGSGDLQVKKQ